VPAPYPAVSTIVRAFLVLACLLTGSPAWGAGSACSPARRGCVAAATWTARACARNCGRLPARLEVTDCRTTCRATRTAAHTACRALPEPCVVVCPDGEASCPTALRDCRVAARRAQQVCRDGCAGGRDLRCVIGCERGRAAAEAACGFVGAPSVAGPGELPDLPAGRAADLSILLDADELAVVAAADARAATVRTRPLRLSVGRPGVAVTLTQTRHAFSFGFPIDFRELQNAPDDLAFYAGIAADHTNLVVAETSLKWRVGEPNPGEFFFDLADDELAWAQGLGFAMKGHTLLWGNAPPFSTGSGIPNWLLAQFPDPSPTDAEREALRNLLRRRVETTVARYRGRIDIWDVTNETLNVFTQWFIDRLGPAIVDDIFRWTRELDPGAQLVFNEWITEVFTGLPGANAAAVRDRVLALRAAGVPIDAVGQQAHFVPGVVYAGGSADLSQRTRIDDYAAALDTLAETGLPLHMTETNFIAPAEPEARAAQAEALMRLWWGHPAVEQIVFWSLWNKVSARNHLQQGLWDDAGMLTRHGEAVVSLLNDRWRTRAVVTADARGMVELQATLGRYVASWEENGNPVHIEFAVDRGPDTAVIAAVP
jgi:GH35 family endo-1,4-beta-xylanase